MTTGVAGIREKIFHSKKRMETAQKVSVIQPYFLLAPYHMGTIKDLFFKVLKAKVKKASYAANTPAVIGRYEMIT